MTFANFLEIAGPIIGVILFVGYVICGFLLMLNPFGEAPCLSLDIAVPEKGFVDPDRYMKAWICDNSVRVGELLVTLHSSRDAWNNQIQVMHNKLGDKKTGQLSMIRAWQYKEAVESIRVGVKANYECITSDGESFQRDFKVYSVDEFEKLYTELRGVNYIM